MDSPIIPSKKQRVALEYLYDSTTNYIGYGGSGFSGKSYVLTRWITNMCLQYPGVGYGIARKTLIDLKKTTLLTLFKVFKELNVTDQRDYNYNGQLNTIEFSNGSTIFLIEMAYKPSDPLYTRLGGYELTGAGVDESVECPIEAINILYTRLGRRRNKEYNITSKLLETFNPAKNHVYRRYYKPYRDGTLKSTYQFIPALPKDNPSPETKDYVKGILDNSDKITIERLIYGNFEYDDDPAKLMEYDNITDLFTNTFVEEGEGYISADIARFGCFDKETEILTNNGWKYFYDLSGKENVLTLNGEKAEWNKITQLYKYSFKGNLNLYDGIKVNFCITDNHNLLVKKSPKSKEYKIEQYQKLPKEFIIKRTNTWNGKNPDKIKFKSIYMMPNGGKRIKEWIFDFKDWAKFIGWFVSEGCVYEEKRKNGRYRILISQKTKGKNELIRELLTKMNIKFRYKAGSFEFSNNEIGKHLLKHCGKYAVNKKIPIYIKEAKTEIIESFLETFGLGDGSKTNTGTWSYVTTSVRLRDELQEVLVKIGKAGKWSLVQKAGSIFYIENRKVIRKHDTYVVNHIKKVRDSDVLKKKIIKYPYNDFVYCVSVPNKIIMVRRKGCTMWSGNSDKTVVMVWRGYRVVKIKSYDRTSITDCADIINELAGEYNIPRSKIIVDEDGIGGGVRDILKCKGFIANSKPLEIKGKKENYNNLKSQCIFRLAEKVNKNEIYIDCFDTDMQEKITEELETVKQKDLDKDNKMSIISKDKMKELLGRSPDYLDTLMMRVALDLQKTGIMVSV